MKKRKEDIQYMIGMVEYLDFEESDDNTMACFNTKAFAIEDHEDRDQTRTLAATGRVFLNRRWLEDFPEDKDVCGFPIWDDTQGAYDTWAAIQDTVARWRKTIEDECLPEIEVCGEDLILFDAIETKAAYRRTGAATAMCRKIRTALVSPYAGALMLALVRRDNREANAFWRSFGLRHNIGSYGSCDVLAGLWMGAYDKWAKKL